MSRFIKFGDRLFNKNSIESVYIVKKTMTKQPKLCIDLRRTMVGGSGYLITSDAPTYHLTYHTDEEVTKEFEKFAAELTKN